MSPSRAGLSSTWLKSTTSQPYNTWRFFTTFEHNGEVLLATDWLLDQEVKSQRELESKAKAPWFLVVWYVNVGEYGVNNLVLGSDMRRYGFLSAGGGTVLL